GAEHSGHELGRELVVGVEESEPSTAGQPEATVAGDRRPGVRGWRRHDHAVAVLAPGDLENDLARPVRRTVVDDDHLEVRFRLSEYAAYGPPDGGLGVVGSDHDAHGRLRHESHLMCPGVTGC